ncbi:MAG TPA: AarF/UbiB family protein [Candidatus Binatia bacterium]|nr:AarF/UbiB family protein [Candidatus Binatia bacterium]
MSDASTIAAGFSQFPPHQWRSTLENLLPQNATAAEKIREIEAGLGSPLGQSLRETMAQWIVDEIVPVDRLVPAAYIKWRPPVRDAMMFVVAHLSPARLAPKLLEQLELPPNTSPEVRLLRLIAKVPGLQKLGQVIARNRHLHPALRKALSKLENGIRDVNPDDIRTIVQQELGAKVQAYDVKVSRTILKEASVSAVVRFTWRDPDTGRRQRGVFKVLKPHIPEYFSEDMDYLQGLARHFGDRHHRYGFPAHLIPDTFDKVRRLLRHEVNFRREQRTLVEAATLYRSYRAIRVPQVIAPLCTRRLTALTEERGIKVTDAVARLPISDRRMVAEQLIEALIAVPLLSATNDAVFHGDPHAGNLLYDRAAKKLVILDWALQEHLGREQRRHLALLFLMASLRDPVGVCHEIVALAQNHPGKGAREEKLVQESVAGFLDTLPVSRFPSAADAMRLLEGVAVQGVKFPGSLIILSKVMFTLEGILTDLVGVDTDMGISVARHITLHWLGHLTEFRSPLQKRDWITLQCSALLFSSRIGIRWQQTMLDRWLTPSPASSAAALDAAAISR